MCRRRHGSQQTNKLHAGVKFHKLPWLMYAPHHHPLCARPPTNPPRPCGRCACNSPRARRHPPPPTLAALETSMRRSPEARVAFVDEQHLRPGEQAAVAAHAAHHALPARRQHPLPTHTHAPTNQPTCRPGAAHTTPTAAGRTPAIVWHAAWLRGAAGAVLRPLPQHARGRAPGGPAIQTTAEHIPPVSKQRQQTTAANNGSNKSTAHAHAYMYGCANV